MKKSILLIITFITMFFIGENNVLAANCFEKSSYTNKCKYYNIENANEFNLYYDEKGSFIEDCWTGTCRCIKYNEELRYDANGVDITSDLIYNNLIDPTNLNECPQELYYYTTSKHIPFPSHYEYYYYYTLSNQTKPLDGTGDEWETYRLYLSDKEKDPQEEDCKTLIDEDIRKYINDIMTIIRIGIPIALIGLIIYDLSTAVFAGSDDKIKKAKERAIKRIIISIVIFFVPTLINFVFDIVNDVWSKNYQICGLETND